MKKKPLKTSWKDHELDRIWHKGIKPFSRGEIDEYELINIIETNMEQALDTMREEGWQTGYQQCKEDKEGFK